MLFELENLSITVFVSLWYVTFFPCLFVLIFFVGFQINPKITKEGAINTTKRLCSTVPESMTACWKKRKEEKPFALRNWEHCQALDENIFGFSPNLHMNLGYIFNRCNV